MADSRGIMARVVRGISIPAMVISAVGLFVPFFSVLHLPFDMWRIHHDCSVINAALSQGPTTMVMIVPQMFGSGYHTCAVVAIVWPVLVGLGLLGVVAGMVVLFWKYGKTRGA